MIVTSSILLIRIVCGWVYPAARRDFNWEETVRGITTDEYYDYLIKKYGYSNIRMDWHNGGWLHLEDGEWVTIPETVPW